MTDPAENDARCSCGNRFDGDNLCLPSACQWEGLEDQRPTAENDALFDGVPDENLRAATGGCTELSCIYHRRINAELRRREAVIPPAEKGQANA